jgi:hypothetical protein
VFKPGSGHVGFVVDKVALGAGFLRVLRLSLAIYIPAIAPQSPSSIIWSWHNRPVVATVPNGLSLTALTTTTTTIIIIIIIIK